MIAFDGGCTASDCILQVRIESGHMYSSDFRPITPKEESEKNAFIRKMLG